MSLQLIRTLTINAAPIPASATALTAATKKAIESLMKNFSDAAAQFRVSYIPAATSGCNVGVLAVSIAPKVRSDGGLPPSPSVVIFAMSETWMKPSARSLGQGPGAYMEYPSIMTEASESMRAAVSAAVDVDWRDAPQQMGPSQVVDVVMVDNKNIPMSEGDRLALVIVRAMTPRILIASMEFARYAPSIETLLSEGMRFPHDIAFGFFDHVNDSGDMVRADCRMTVWTSVNKDVRQQIGTVYATIDLLYTPSMVEGKPVVFTPQVVITDIVPEVSAHPGWFIFLMLFSVNLTAARIWPGMLVYTPPSFLRQVHAFDAIATEVPLFPDEIDTFKSNNHFMRTANAPFARRTDHLESDTRRLLAAIRPTASLAVAAVPGTVTGMRMRMVAESGKMMEGTLSTLLGEEFFRNSMGGGSASLFDNFRSPILPAGVLRLPGGQEIALDRGISYFAIASLLGETNPELLAKLGEIEAESDVVKAVSRRIDIMKVAPGLTDSAIDFRGVSVRSTLSGPVIGAVARTIGEAAELGNVTGAELLNQHMGRASGWMGTAPSAVTVTLGGSPSMHGGGGKARNNPYGIS